MTARPTNRKSYYDLSNGAKVTPFFDAEYLRNGTYRQFQWNTNKD